MSRGPGTTRHQRQKANRDKGRAERAAAALDRLRDATADIRLTREEQPVTPTVTDPYADLAEEVRTTDPLDDRDADGSVKPSRRVVLRSFSDLDDDVPTWAWEYGGAGRIPLGGLTLWAGRPGAGKSTAARWLTAQATRGTLPGEWFGTPVNVAYIAREESGRLAVKPSLRAAQVDMSRVFYPEVEQTTETGGVEVLALAGGDLDALVDVLAEAEVRLIVVDPLMSFAGAKVDINRNNEVRAMLEPWRQLAERLDAVVLGIAHLNKSGNGDVVAGINGSSAFGELARAVFGFAADPDSDDGVRVMSQSKNSGGPEDLALEYRIDTVPVTTSTGRTADVAKFTILGRSERTVSDILRDSGSPRDGDARDVDDWLRGYLKDGRKKATDVFQAADANGYTKDQVKRAKRRCKVEAFKEGTGGWWWQAVIVIDVEVVSTDDPIDTHQGSKGAQGSKQGSWTRGSAPLLPSRSEGVREGVGEAREQGSISREMPPPSVLPSVVDGADTDSHGIVRRAILAAVTRHGDRTKRELQHLYGGKGPALRAAVPTVIADMVASGELLAVDVPHADGRSTKTVYRLPGTTPGRTVVLCRACNEPIGDHARDDQTVGYHSDRLDCIRHHRAGGTPA